MPKTLVGYLTISRNSDAWLHMTSPNEETEIRQIDVGVVRTPRSIPTLSTKYSLTIAFLESAIVVRTIALLGFVANVVALSSLLYSAFQEPISPYMQEIMGGVLQTYASLRDAVFDGVGSAPKKLTNWLHSYFRWLPSAPCFTLSSIGRDVIVLYALGASAAFRTMQGLIKVKHGPTNWHWLLRVLRDSVFWPIAMSLHLLLWFSGSKPAERSHTGFISFYRQLFWVFIGAAIFFLLVFAENMIGL